MSYKELVVYVEKDERCLTAIDFACEFAKNFESQVTGLYVLPNEPVMMVADAQIPEKVLASIRADEEDQMNAARKLFEERVAHYDVRTRWQATQGYSAEKYIAYLRYADIGIVAQPDPGYSASSSFVNEVLLGAGCPMIIAPHDGRKSAALAKHVAVAWNESRESARAVRDALPLLQHARRVDVITVHDRASDEINPAVGLCEHLAKHGVIAEAHELVSDGGPGAGAGAIKQFAKERSCEILVMGAWGHSRVREILLGGVTHDMLTDSALPIFLSH
jgi:nucleotide-binding universal stress UspA family protein